MLDAVIELFSGSTEREQRISDLNRLENHELADLGLVRDQIEAFVDAQMASAS